jgi:glycosyltransferase involved in cell wall biosynthesis
MQEDYKVLMIASYASSLVNFRGHLIRALSEIGCDVHVAAPGLSGDSVAGAQLHEWGVTCHNIFLQRAGTNPVYDLRGLHSLVRLMLTIRPKSVVSYTIKPVIYGTIAAWWTGVPHRFALITGLGYTFSNTATRRGRLLQRLACELYRLALTHTERVFFQNPDDQALFRKLNLLPRRVPSIVLNGSGVDLSHFGLVPLPPGPVVFLLIARLLGDKGVREYVAAAAEVQKHYPSAVFRLVGYLDDNPDSVHQDEVTQWQLDGIIEYLGRMEDVRPAIANCSVYVLPSYREGTSRTVLEAMAMGRAVITTDAPGCRETVVDGDNGFLVPVKAVNELACAMERFISQPELILRMGVRSREIAEQKYDVHKVNAQMLECMGIRPQVG